MTTIACVVIASRHRMELLDGLVLPSVLRQQFDEVVVVGDYHSGDGYRHLPVPPITRTTVDALVKRDVGVAATSSEWIVFLCDDHILTPNFADRLRFDLVDRGLGREHVGVPTRIALHPTHGPVELNTGLPNYCGGHAGVFHRSAVQDVPWCVAPHHPNWDVYHSHMLLSRGYHLIPLPECIVEDVEPNATPWR